VDAASVEQQLRRARRRLAWRRFLFGRSHRSTGDAYFQAGVLYRLAGEMDAAARCLALAERIHRQRLGPGHPAVALDLFSIGEYQAHWGERRRAVASYQKAQRILEANLKKDPAGRYPAPAGTSLAQHLAFVLCNLGGVHRDLEEQGKARTCFERSLKILVAELGAGSDDAVHLAHHLVQIGVDPLPAVREAGGEPATSLLAEAFRRVHGFEPVPEPIS
jgi:tetratricopeptide (TPR) repeat protein